MAANHARMHRPVSSISGKQSQPDHYLLLEGRLKAIEAERKALTELNASLQEENQTLRQLSAQYQLGGICFS